MRILLCRARRHDDRASRAALAKRGFARGDRIAIVSANRVEFIAAYFGIMRAGLVAVPVNYRFPKKTIHFIIQDAGAKLVFCDRASRENCPEDLPAVVFGEEGGEGFDRFVDPGEFETVIPKPREPAMFLYTSGSTGVPKGVVLSHQSHIWVVETRLSPDLERHRYLIAAPLYHMNALALAKLACAAHATIVLLPRFEAKAYIEAIGQYRPTWLTAVPPMIAMMLRERETLAQTDLSSVEFIRMGSAPVSASLMECDPPRVAARPRSPTPMARPKPGRWCSARIRRACRSRTIRSAIRIRRCSCAWSTATTAMPSRACWR